MDDKSDPLRRLQEWAAADGARIVEIDFEGASCDSWSVWLRRKDLDLDVYACVFPGKSPTANLIYAGADASLATLIDAALDRAESIGL